VKALQAILIIFSMLYASMVYSQVKDKQTKSIRIPAEKSKKDKDSIPLRIKVAPKFEKEADKSEGPKNENKNFITKESEKPFSMVYDDGLKSSGEIFEKRWKKELVKGGVIKTMSDQFLGEHKVDTKFVNIVCRDHEYPDGDRVQIMLNGYIVKHNLLLTNSYRRVEVNLAQGKNIVDIIALNQGDSGPNTAEFVVYDDRGKVISSKEWNLLTGVKARIVFNNEKTVIQPKEGEKEENDEASNN
jgi:hypothetical protein